MEWMNGSQPRLSITYKERSKLPEVFIGSFPYFSISRLETLRSYAVIHRLAYIRQAFYFSVSRCHPKQQLQN